MFGPISKLKIKPLTSNIIFFPSFIVYFHHISKEKEKNTLQKKQKKQKKIRHNTILCCPIVFMVLFSSFLGKHREGNTIKIVE